MEIVCVEPNYDSLHYCKFYFVMENLELIILAKQSVDFM